MDRQRGLAQQAADDWADVEWPELDQPAPLHSQPAPPGPIQLRSKQRPQERRPERRVEQRPPQQHRPEQRRPEQRRPGQHRPRQNRPGNHRRRPRYSPAVVRRRQVAAALLTLLVVTVLVLALTGLRGDRPAPAQAQDAAVSRVAPAGPAATVNSTEDRPGTSAPAVAPTTAAKTSATKVVQRGAGTLAVVPGSSKAPGRGPVQRVRVEVERGIGENGRAFADVVMATLNDPRSWGHGGSRTFARTDGPADIRVILASPDTSSSLCRPLVTKGTLSCSVGDKAIITAYRWALATPEFPDLGVYRQYVVNHEVGHVLGKGHERCPGPGRLAPLMQQQTIKVAPCKPNAWPNP